MTITAQSRISDLMADGRERTVDDVALRLKLNRSEALRELRGLAKDNKIISFRISGDRTAWRMPR